MQKVFHISLHPTFFNVSKYSGVLVNAVKAASWKGAGAESVSLIWIFLIAVAMQEGAIAHPILQPNREQLNQNNFKMKIMRTIENKICLFLWNIQS